MSVRRDKKVFVRILVPLVCAAVQAICCNSYYARGKGVMHMKELESAGLEEGSPVNVAPFGQVKSWEEGHDIGIIWEDPRDIFSVDLRYADGIAAPRPENVRIQYWVSQWPTRRIPRYEKSGAGGSGWLDVGDWFRGRWKDADTELDVKGASWRYRFRPVNEKEFPQLKNFGASYRSTLKLRLVFSRGVPEISRLAVYTDSVWKRTHLSIIWDGNDARMRNGRLEAFNGAIDGITALPEGGTVRIVGANEWQWQPTRGGAGIVAQVWYAQPKAVNSFDETVATVRTADGGFSFSPAEVVREGQVFLPDFSVLVTTGQDVSEYATVAASWKHRKDKDLYSRVFDMPEQTLQRAWSDMPRKGHHYIPLGWEGARQRFGVEANGDVFVHKGWLKRVGGKDSPHASWEGDGIRFKFGLPDSEPVERYIEDSCLPIVHTTWRRGDIEYGQTAFVVPFEGIPAPGQIRGDDTMVLLTKIVAKNTGSAPTNAHLLISTVTDEAEESLTVNDGLIYSRKNDSARLRMMVRVDPQATFAEEDNKIAIDIALDPGGSSAAYVKIPYITLSSADELARLRQLDVEKEHTEAARYWRNRIDAGTQIMTPEDMINSFYRAHAAHLLINTEREVGSERYMAKVGSFHYGVYSNESCMMISDLDRRGYHDTAEGALETFLHYQGAVGLPGDFSTKEGVFYGAGGYEAGGYNQHHGWVLWCLGEHYWYTRDAQWLRRAAPKIVKGCDWISKERHRTMDTLDPIRAIEHGLMPPGRLEDIGDYRCWLSTNAYSYWGMENAARALADIGHPEAQRLLDEAEEYREDIVRAFREAMVRSPVVRLRDGTYIPHMPPDVHRRGRSFGWITETLEGAIHMIRCGVLNLHDRESTWIIKDFEDNLYLSEQYGYTLGDFDRYWFSRGGFSMQPNLLCNPVPYLMRDEIKHFLRAYFNAFAVGFFPDTCMMTEHPLPHIGDWRGDHYKSSDESQSTYWLRLMFIMERGADLYLGMGLPRSWLNDGQQVSITRAETYFGTTSFTVESHAAAGKMRMIIDPPTRNLPEHLYVRFRHPENIPIARVTVNGKEHHEFDPERELVLVPSSRQGLEVIAFYNPPD